MNNQFALGHEQIDQEHSMLFQILDSLLAHGALTYEDLSKLVAGLRDYVLFHFRSEESLMQAANWPKTQGHIAMHRLLEDTVDLFSATLGPQSDPEDFRKRLHVFLIEWLTIHILEHDAMFVKFLATQR